MQPLLQVGLAGSLDPRCPPETGTEYVEQPFDGRERERVADYGDKRVLSVVLWGWAAPDGGQADRTNHRWMWRVQQMQSDEGASIAHHAALSQTAIYDIARRPHRAGCNDGGSSSTND
jgi:hypothetical protein